MMDSGDQKGHSTITNSTTIKSKASDKIAQKMWLQQHLLFPSLCKLRALDESKRLVGNYKIWK